MECIDESSCAVGRMCRPGSKPKDEHRAAYGNNRVVSYFLCLFVGWPLSVSGSSRAVVHVVCRGSIGRRLERDRPKNGSVHIDRFGYCIAF